MTLLEQMKAERPSAVAQREAELRKQAETRTTMDTYQTEPSPRPTQRYPGDEGVRGEYADQRFIGDDEIDDEDDERSEHRRERDAQSAVGESEGGGVMKAQATGLIGSDPECQRIEKRVEAIDREIRKVRRYETGSPVTKSAVRGTTATLLTEKRELLNRYAILKSVGTQRSQATHRASDGVMNTGPLPAPRPFGLHG
jgi:hypothetical protein